jgi:hypothetical protein
MPGTIEEDAANLLAKRFCREGKAFSREIFSLSSRIWDASIPDPEYTAFNEAWLRFGKLCHMFEKEDFRYLHGPLTTQGNRWEVVLELSSKIESACGALDTKSGRRRWPEWFWKRTSESSVVTLEGKAWKDRFDAMLYDFWNPARNELCDILGLLHRKMGIADGFGGAVYVSSISCEAASLPREVSFSSCYGCGHYTLLLDQESRMYNWSTVSSELDEHEDARKALTLIARSGARSRQRLQWDLSPSEEDEDSLYGDL